MSEQSRFALPYLAEIFGALSRGRHLCLDDGNLFVELREHEREFEELFQHLGYQMIADSRGFYYFHALDSQSASPRTAKLALFFLVLVEALWEESSDINDLESLLLDRSWSLGELPHLKRERYLELMRQLDQEPDTETLRDLIRQLVYFGFAAWDGEERFRFRLPALRFLDIAREVAEGLERTQNPEDVAMTADAEASA